MEQDMSGAAAAAVSYSLLQCETTDTGLMHRVVCLYTPQLSPAQYSYCQPRRDGQAELTWVGD